MTSHRQRPAHKIWRNWKRISFSSQMLWNRKQQKLCRAPEYDPGQEDALDVGDVKSWYTCYFYFPVIVQALPVPPAAGTADIANWLQSR